MRRVPLKRKTRLKPASDKQKTIKQLDTLLRQAVLLRDSFRCRRCGKDRHSHPQPVLQAAHIYGKGARPSMRYVLDNVICLCKPCHFWWHQIGFGREARGLNEVRQFVLKAVGEQRMARLDLMASVRGRKPDHNLERIMLQQEITRYMERPQT